MPSSCMLARNSTKVDYELPMWLLTFPLIPYFPYLSLCFDSAKHQSLQLALNCGFNPCSSGLLPTMDTHVSAQRNMCFTELGLAPEVIGGGTTLPIYLPCP